MGDCEYVNYDDDVGYYVDYDNHHYHEDGNALALALMMLIMIIIMMRMAGCDSDAEDFDEGVLPMEDWSRGACFKLRPFKIQVILYQACQC